MAWDDSKHPRAPSGSKDVAQLTDEHRVQKAGRAAEEAAGVIVGWRKGSGDEELARRFLEARTLDCFDGYLPDFYSKFGFVEYKREPNWVPGKADVVYMRLEDK